MVTQHSTTGEHARGIIFDAANTIFENRNGFNARAEARKLLGLPNEQYVRNLIFTLSADSPGMNCDEFVDALLKRTKGKTDPGLAVGLRNAWLHFNDSLNLRPDALAVLTTLRKRGKKLALVSNCTPFLGLLMRSHQLDAYFDTILLSCDVGLLKPDPRIFDLAMARMGTSPTETCVVGDKVKTDILGGTLAGCKTILLEARCQSPVVNPQLPLNAVITSLSDILELPLFESNPN